MEFPACLGAKKHLFYYFTTRKYKTKPPKCHTCYGPLSPSPDATTTTISSCWGGRASLEPLITSCQPNLLGNGLFPSLSSLSCQCIVLWWWWWPFEGLLDVSKWWEWCSTRACSLNEKKKNVSSAKKEKKKKELTRNLRWICILSPYWVSCCCCCGDSGYLMGHWTHRSGGNGEVHTHVV